MKALSKTRHDAPNEQRTIVNACLSPGWFFWPNCRWHRWRMWRYSGNSPNGIHPYSPCVTDAPQRDRAHLATITPLRASTCSAVVRTARHQDAFMLTGYAAALALAGFIPLATQRCCSLTHSSPLLTYCASYSVVYPRV